MEYRLLIETSNPADIAMIKSLLDSERIVYFVHGEAFSAIRPMVEPARFMVAEDRLEEAERLIKRLLLSYNPMTSTPRNGPDDD